MIAREQKNALVFMSDFGLNDRFVASMKGVAFSVDQNLQIFDLTHLIEPFNIWEGALTLTGTIKYWPAGTVFVAVVDPGVGTDRKSVVLKTHSGHFIVAPDNGILTFVAEQFGIAGVRQIDESINRLVNSFDSHTFHGRDVYAFTGARLASGKITFEEVGALLKPQVVRLPYQKAKKISLNTIVGQIVKIEKPYGNISTNIPRDLFDELAVNFRLKELVRIEIFRAKKTVFTETLPCVNSFGFVEKGELLLYIDSMQMIGLAVNSGYFSEKFEIQAGVDWSIQITKTDT